MSIDHHATDTEDQTGVMNRQSKQDLAAGVSIAMMFAGAFILPVTALGFALIAAGVIAMLTLFLLTVFQKS